MINSDQVPNYPNLFFQILKVGLFPHESLTEPFSQSSLIGVYQKINTYLESIERQENIKHLNKKEIFKAFSHYYFFCHFDRLMKEVAISIGDQPLTKRAMLNTILMWDQLQQVESYIDERLTVSINRLEYRASLKILNNPFLSSFISIQAERGKQFFNKMEALSPDGYAPIIEELKIILGATDKDIGIFKLRRHFFKNIYDSFVLQIENKKGPKLIKQRMLIPLIEIVDPTYYFPTQQEWQNEIDAKDTVGTVTYNDQIGILVNRFFRQ